MPGDRKRSRLRPIILGAILLLWVGNACWHANKPLPDGVRVNSELTAIDAQQLHLLTDISSANNYGEFTTRQNIHAATLELVRNAHDFLVLDYFLFNSQGGPAGQLRYEHGIRPVARELRDAVLTLHNAQPQLPILLIIDPINGYYRDTPPDDMADLEHAGIDIVVTRLNPLRDSNPLYSTTWRLLAGWWLKPGVNGAWSNPLDKAGPKLTLGALLRLPNFKANHRKVALTGDGTGSLLGIVGSANPHDGSSAHSNVALQLQGEALRPLLNSELAIAGFSGWNGKGRFDKFLAPQTSVVAPTLSAADTTRAAIATEGAIRTTLIEALESTAAADSVDIAQFYLSDRPVIDALLAAARRGAVVRVLLDPNKDAFGFEKSGLPNREVASELVAASDGAIKLRWYRTHGEQFHSKVAAIRHNGRLWLTVGSANFTRRNIGDYNLEANVIVDAPLRGTIDQAVSDWFETLWNNHPGGTEYTADAEVYAEPSQGRYWLYRLMESRGLSTF
jgi:phosphatidylserine/phosphatidylglycerophosphate/cardiolipin synthase-like enzyme